MPADDGHPDIPRFADLRGLARSLGTEAPYNRIEAVIRSANVKQSCLGDVVQAGDSLTALDELLASPRRRGSSGRRATEAALLTHAVLLYARATGNSGQYGERGPVTIAAKLTAEQRSDHDALLRVRNRASAHVYPHEVTVDDVVWAEDVALLVEIGPAWQPVVSSRSTQLHLPTVERLRRLLPVAQEILAAAFQTALNKLTAVLRDHPAPLEAFEANLIDPVAVFGSEEAVRQALAGRQAGRATIYR
jgi:hypothetical protein